MSSSIYGWSVISHPPTASNALLMLLVIAATGRGGCCFLPMPAAVAAGCGVTIFMRAAMC